MKDAIQCKYTCIHCGIYRQLVTVPARGSEEVTDWVEKICLPLLAADHERRARSNCPRNKLDEVLIPIASEDGTKEAEKIGGPLL